MDKIAKIGIIGAGHIAEKMAVTLLGMEGVELYAIAARDASRAAAFAEKWGFTKSYGSYETLADDAEVDLIYVATPHSHHYGQVKMCLERGKAVLCEKAFTANAREAEELVALSQEKGVFLSEAIWTRFMPFSKKISELVHSGMIGKPMMITASLGYPMANVERILRPELCGGALLDIGVYPINFMMMLFGNDYSRVTSTCYKGETGVDLQNSMTFTYPDGRMAVMQTTAFCANDRQGVISGTEGYIIVDNINNPQTADVYSADHILVEHFECEPQITGYEYEVIESLKAMRCGAVETEFMPHAETLRVMRLLDSLRAEWGVKYPMD